MKSGTSLGEVYMFLDSSLSVCSMGNALQSQVYPLHIRIGPDRTASVYER
jgi:hypothetical protein